MDYLSNNDFTVAELDLRPNNMAASKVGGVGRVVGVDLICSNFVLLLL